MKFDMSDILVFEEVANLVYCSFKKNNYCLMMFTIVELDEQISNKLLIILFLNGSLW